MKLAAGSCAVRKVDSSSSESDQIYCSSHTEASGTNLHTGTGFLIKTSNVQLTGQSVSGLATKTAL